MRWQDGVIGAAQCGFSGALIPSMLPGAGRPALLTCVATAALLVGVVAALASLRLRFSALTAGACLLCWVILAAQQVLF